MIFVQPFHCRPPESIQKSTEFYLGNHTKVRNEIGEIGIMCPVGNRVDVRSSCVNQYKETKKMIDGNGKQILKLCLPDFDMELKRVCCKDSYKKEINAHLICHKYFSHRDMCSPHSHTPVSDKKA